MARETYNLRFTDDGEGPYRNVVYETPLALAFRREAGVEN